jgi:hypothetical protein
MGAVIIILIYVSCLWGIIKFLELNFLQLSFWKSISSEWTLFSSIHAVSPFVIPFLIGYPKPIFNFLDGITQIAKDFDCDPTNYINWVLFSMGLFFVLSLLGGPIFRSYDTPTGKSFKGRNGEIFSEYETRSEEIDTGVFNIFNWSPKHRQVIKLHFLFFSVVITTKFFMFINILFNT